MNRKPMQSGNIEWPKQDNFKRSIRFDFSLYVAVIVIVLMAVTGYVITEKYVATVTEQVIDKLLVQARSFSSAAGKHFIGGEQPDDLMLNAICKKLTLENPEIHWAGIANKEGIFLAHTDIRKVVTGHRLRTIHSSGYDDLLRPGEAFEQVDKEITLTMPIKENGVVVGRLGLGASAGRIAVARRSSILAVASITVIMLLIGVPVTMIMVSRKLRPISLITRELQSVDFDNLRIDPGLNSRDEFGYLSETLKCMGGQIKLARDQAIESERVARELEIAREIQENILPRSYPNSQQFVFAGAYKSAYEVGGDYYDFIEFDERHLGFLVADVSGKSLPGMLVMLLTRDIVKRVSHTTMDPAELLAQVNEELLPHIRTGMFVTMALAVLDKETGRLMTASAGHNPTLLVSGENGRIETVKPPGYPLGMMPPDMFNERVGTSAVQMKPGDSIVLYTDGVNEARNTADEEFGMDRFRETISQAFRSDPTEIVSTCLSVHERFVGACDQFDDITLLVMKWTTGSSTQLSRFSEVTTHAE